MFVPGNNPGMMQDAFIYSPDSIMLDLEDSVTMAEKDAARLLVYNALKTIDYGTTEMVVRINPLNTPYGKKDVEATTTTDNAAKSTEKTVEAAPAAQYDLFYVEGGQLFFYDLQSNEATPFANEHDSIVRAVLSKKNVLYYSVAKDGELLLRSLDLNIVNPMPEQLADWEVTVEGRKQWKTVPEV